MPRKPRTEEQRARDRELYHLSKPQPRAPINPEVLASLLQVQERLLSLIEDLVPVLHRTGRGPDADRTVPSGLKPTEVSSRSPASSSYSSLLRLSGERREFQDCDQRTGTGPYRSSGTVPVQAAQTYRNGTSEAPTSETRVLRSQPDTPLQDRRAQSSGARDLEELGEAREAGGET